MGTWQGGSRRSLLPRKVGWGLGRVGPGGASSLGRWDGDLAGHRWQLVGGAGSCPWSCTCWEAPPRRSLRRSWPTRVMVCFSRKQPTSQRESPTRDLPDLLRKVPTAVGAAFSATGNTESRGVGGRVLQWPSSRVSHEVRNWHFGWPPGIYGRGLCSGSSWSACGPSAQLWRRAVLRLALRGILGPGGGLGGPQASFPPFSRDFALDSGQPLLEG